VTDIDSVVEVHLDDGHRLRGRVTMISPTWLTLVAGAGTWNVRRDRVLLVKPVSVAEFTDDGGGQGVDGAGEGS
jgi:hypothetical protein